MKVKIYIVTPDKHFPMADMKAISVVCQAIEIIKPDGSQKLTDSGVSLEEDAEKLGIELAERLRSKAPSDFFSWL